MRSSISILAAFIMFLSALPVLPARAAEGKELLPMPDVLEPEFRTKQPVQFELSPFAGSYLGNTAGQTWTAGMKTYVHANSTFSFGVRYAYAELLTDRTTRFGGSLTTNNLHVIAGETMISNDVAMRAGRSIMEVDFYLTLGVGVIYINADWQPTGVIGGGAKFYTPLPWLAFRVDVDNYAHYTDLPGGEDNFDFDVTFTGGVSILIPPKKR